MGSTDAKVVVRPWPPDLPVQPPAELRWRRRFRLGQALAELWSDREVIRSLVERDIRVRYSQAFLGLAWAVLAPLSLMMVFTVFFNRVAEIETGGVPYPLFSYAGLVPWTFFAASVSIGGNSLVANVSLLNKVYCPREVFPIASVLAAAFDALCSTAIFAVLMVAFGVAPGWAAVWLPVYLVVLLVFTTAVTLLVAATTVYLRDVRHAIPLIVQLGLFATPVIYALAAIPERWRMLYVAVNPMAEVIDGIRRSVLLDQAPQPGYTLVAASSSVLLLAVAFRIFKRLETGMADVA